MTQTHHGTCARARRRIPAWAHKGHGAVRTYAVAALGLAITGPHPRRSRRPSALGPANCCARVTGNTEQSCLRVQADPCTWYASPASPPPHYTHGICAKHCRIRHDRCCRKTCTSVRIGVCVRARVCVSVCAWVWVCVCLQRTHPAQITPTALHAKTPLHPHLLKGLLAPMPATGTRLDLQAAANANRQVSAAQLCFFAFSKRDHCSSRCLSDALQVGSSGRTMVPLKLQQLGPLRMGVTKRRARCRQ